MVPLALLVCGLGGCDRHRDEASGEPPLPHLFPTAGEAPASTPATRPIDVPAEAAEAEEAAEAAEAALDPRFATGAILAARSIGHSSLVLKLKLEGGLEAAWKPRSRIGNRRYRGEVAAYRLARALGLANVPRAVLRRVPAGAILPLLEPQLARGVVPEPDGSVEGALIPWVPGLSFLALEKDPAWSAWRLSLSTDGDAGPALPAGRAEAIAIMVAFDFVTGNWDRWSGGNVGFADGRVLFIDNDGAFYESPPAAALSRQRRLLRGIRRFPPSFVTALHDVDLAGALGNDGAGAPLLTAKALASAEARRREALIILDATLPPRPPPDR